MKITQETLIADVINEVPGAKKVIDKYFAGACQSCPSFQMETIAEGALMHNLDAEMIVKEINKLQKKSA